MIKVKLTGTEQELHEVVNELEKSMVVSEVNGPHKDRNSKFSRMYANLELKNKVIKVDFFSKMFSKENPLPNVIIEMSSPNKSSQTEEKTK